VTNQVDRRDNESIDRQRQWHSHLTAVFLVFVLFLSRTVTLLSGILCVLTSVYLCSVCSQVMSCLFRSTYVSCLCTCIYTDLPKNVNAIACSCTIVFVSATHYAAMRPYGQLHGTAFLGHAYQWHFYCQSSPASVIFPHKPCLSLCIIFV